MGYRVGRVCHAELADAQNEIMTMVVPTIDKDGVLRHPVFNGQSWEYQGQTINLHLPQCNEFEYSELGHQVGKDMVFVFVAILIAVVLKKFIWMQREESE